MRNSFKLFILILMITTLSACNNSFEEKTDQVSEVEETVEVEEEKLTADSGVPAALFGTPEGDEIQKEIDKLKEERSKASDKKLNSTEQDSLGELSEEDKKRSKNFHLHGVDAVEIIKDSPTIGMTDYEARESTWGKPQKINKTTTAYGVREQWVYPNYKYLYFEDGYLTTIQE